MTSRTKSGDAGKQNADSKKLHFAPPRLTADQIMKNGQDAANLLNAPVMNLAFESVIKDLQDQWLQSNPEEQKLREWLYTKAQALGHVAVELSGYVNMAREIDSEVLHKQQLEQQNTDADIGFMQ